MWIKRFGAEEMQPTHPSKSDTACNSLKYLKWWNKNRIVKKVILFGLFLMFKTKMIANKLVVCLIVLRSNYKNFAGKNYLKLMTKITICIKIWLTHHLLHHSVLQSHFRHRSAAFASLLVPWRCSAKLPPQSRPSTAASFSVIKYKNKNNLLIINHFFCKCIL